MQTEGVETQHAFGIDIEKRMAKEFKNICGKYDDNSRYSVIFGHRGFFKKNSAKHHYHSPNCRQYNCIHNVAQPPGGSNLIVI
jgi:hypothetical protein